MAEMPQSLDLDGSLTGQKAETERCEHPLRAFLIRP